MPAMACRTVDRKKKTGIRIIFSTGTSEGKSEAGMKRECDDCEGMSDQVRARQPLVHLLTNYVTVTDCVNALLAVGARAICSHAPEEAAQVTRGADALVCNLGGTEYYDAMEISFAAAMEKGIPIVIDPVGCGASSHRRRMCLRLIGEYAQCISGTLAVRGNYAEIDALIRGHSDSPGLDDLQRLNDGEEHTLEKRMMSFARRNHVLLIASGETDLCTDGTDLKEIHRGTPALRRITGAGCLSSAVLAAYLAAGRADAPQGLSETGRSRFGSETQTVATAPGMAGNETSPGEPLKWVAAAVSRIGLAGETALEASRQSGTGAGHFHMYLMDALSAGDPLWQ